MFVLVMLMVAAGAAFGQIAQPDNNVEQPAVQLTSTVTASATAERVRFTAPSNITSMRIEVFNENAGKIFDSSVHAGNLFDWQLQGSQSLGDGTYLCVVTVQSLSGRVSRKLGTVSVAHQQLLLRPANGSQLAPMQKQTLAAAQPDGETTELIEPLIIIDPNQPIPLTAIAHDGNDGQVIRSKGALSFRVGDFFSGSDTEQMRLTEEGNLGIGTAKPKFKLDVAGPIRARQGFVFRNGSTLNVNDQGALTLTSSSGSVTSSVAGTGTQGQVAKWTDNSGTLGNSVLTEAASTTLSTTLGPMVGVNATLNNTGLGNSALQVRSVTLNGPGDLATGLDIAPTFAPSANISSAQGFVSAAYAAPPTGVTITDQFGGNSTIVYNNVSGAVTNGTNFNIASPVVFGILKPTTQTGLRIRNQGIGGTANSYGLFVDAQSGSANNYSAIFAGGNVGIGTTSPSAKLEVSDNCCTGTSAILFSTSFGGSNGFIGRSAGGTSSSPSQTLAGDTLSFFGGRGFTNGFGFINASSAAIRMVATEDFTGFGSGTSIIFETSRNGDGAIERAERMRIDQNGNVGIGTATPAFKLDVRDGTGASFNGGHVQIGAQVAGADEKLIVFGDSTCGLSGTRPCLSIGEQDADDRMVLVARESFRFSRGNVLPDSDNVQSLGSTTNRWTEVWAVNGTIQTSDVRLKRGITNLKYGLSQVMQLRPVSFQWKAGNDNRTHLGLIAQEVDAVMPEAVEKSADANAPLGMNYSNLIPVLIKAIQEQQGTLERAQAEIKTLRTENEALSKRIVSIELTSTSKVATSTPELIRRKR